jgi:hypothetical protein
LSEPFHSNAIHQPEIQNKTKKLFILLHLRQGDQIGRIFAYWAIVYFGQFILNYRSRPNVRTTFFQQKKMHVLILA